MMELIRALRSALDAEMDHITRTTGAGAAADWADYRHRVGLLAGLKRAMGVLNEEVKKWNEDET